MPLVTLTSDIGFQDYLVGAAKGKLLQINPGFIIADITHLLPPFNYTQSAYICRNAIKNFPAHTFHIVLVNLFEHKTENLLLAFYEDQYILCADNGLLTMIAEGKPEVIIRLKADKKKIKNTLYCIEVMGQAIQAITEGKRLQDIGQPDPEITEKNPLRPFTAADSMEGQIIFIDNFENVIINITREQFEEQRRNRKFRIETRRNDHIETLSDTYADVPEGEKLALFNSAGYLEIAINKGNAAGLLFGLMGYKEEPANAYLQNRLFYNVVKIYFE
ncbi:MAG TPA: SAM-dependent chlorinase/fluorinase [Chitinophagaceae bacterium]|nr:SAM-dependent chlorinase/fluorinase [Chitinophagaceae bacterium]